MNITQYRLSEISDPTGILVGKRYEFYIYVEFESDDDLLDVDAAGIRTIYIEESDKISSTYFFKKGTEEALEFELEEEEYEEILAFCRAKVTEDNNSTLAE